MKVYASFIKEALEEIAASEELKDKPITLFYDYPIRDISELQQNPVNILLIQEPNQLFGFHDWTVNNYELFSGVFTWGQSILEVADNAMFFPFGAGDFEMPSTYKHNKQFGVSFMCGPKQLIEGHHLRHRIYSRQSEVSIPTQFFYKGEKRPCWTTMFHIGVENSRNQGYFTEKIIDAFLSKTVPIYWGCPNLGDFFDLDGVITFNDEHELLNILNNLTEEDYNKRKKAIEYNYQQSLQYADFVGRVKQLLVDICNLNNL